MTNAALKGLTRPVKDELNRFEDIFKQSLKSKVGLVDLVTRYIIKQKGKKVRPLLVLLSAALSGGVNERTYRGATLVELLHTATLVHDDVVDNADTRRGFPSINAVWKNKVAVLMGDYLLSRGLLIAVEGEDFDFLRVMTNTVKRMSEGELLQIQKTRKLDIDEESYFSIISDKTASLIETCCEIGALSASRDETRHAAMKRYGNLLGLSFQIRDDILDYDGSTSLFGKPIGGDIKEKKITLPLIYALGSVSASEAAAVRKLIKNGAKKDAVQQVIDFVHTHKGIEAAHAKALQLAAEAKQCLTVFPDSEVKATLLSLVDFVVERRS